MAVDPDMSAEYSHEVCRGGGDDDGLLGCGVVAVPVGHDRDDQRLSVRRPDHGDVVRAAVVAVPGLVGHRPAVRYAGLDGVRPRGVASQPVRQQRAFRFGQRATEHDLLIVTGEFPWRRGVARIMGGVAVQLRLVLVHPAGGVAEPRR